MADEIAPEVRDLLALNLVPGLGPRLTAALLRHFGSAASVRNATAEQLLAAPRIGAKLSADFAGSLSRADVDAECERIARFGVRLLVLGGDGYPESLAQIAGAPHILYSRGTLTLADRRAVAIVGSRSATNYGKKLAEQLSSGLSRAGYTIVSGLARGIDAIAHAAALKAGGRTIAVLAGGLSRIYPPEHTELAALVEASGALLSEAPMAAEPLPQMFPSRNRIISGLARGVIVVEASDRSGSLITARHAGEQGRDVFAVPGLVTSPSSAGCHRLIRDGATLIRNVDDVLETLRAQDEAADVKPLDQTTLFDTKPANVVAPDLAGPELRVWEFLAPGAQFADVMAQELQIDIAELSRLLMQLEIKKAVRRLPGNRYERR